MPDNPYLMDEKNIPANWQPIDSPMPAGVSAPPVPHDMPQYFSGSLPPSLQHDASFVATEMGSPRIPKTALMPFGNQANPIANAAAQSTAIKVVQAAAAAATAAAQSDVESIAVNPQAGTSYTVQLGDRNTVISLSNNSGGTVLLPGTEGGKFLQATPATQTSGATASLSMNVSKGSVIVLFCKIGSNTVGNPTAVDTQSNAWSYVDGAPESTSGLFPTHMLYTYNAVGGPVTITVTGPVGSVALLLWALEYSGMPTASAPLDQHAANGSPSTQTPPITTGAYSTLVVAAFSGGAVNTNFAPAAGWTTRFNDNTRFVEDEIVTIKGTSVTGATNPVLTLSSSVNIIASFRTAPIPSQIPAGWFTYIENTGTGAGIFNVVAPSSQSIDGVFIPLTLGPGQGVLLVFDGSNWYTVRGGSGGVASLNSLVGNVTLTAGTNVTVTTVGNSLQISAASSGAANITPDTHPGSAGTLDDEFEAGSFDTLRWTSVGVTTGGPSVSKGSLSLAANTDGSNVHVIQTAPASPWEVVAKTALGGVVPASGFKAGGFTVFDSGSHTTAKIVLFRFKAANGFQFGQDNFTNLTTYSSTPSTVNPVSGVIPPTLWLKLKNDGTNLIFSYSTDGINFATIITYGVTTFLGAAAYVGLDVEGNGGGTAAVYSFDYFRRTL